MSTLQLPTDVTSAHRLAMNDPTSRSPRHPTSSREPEAPDTGRPLAEKNSSLPSSSPAPQGASAAEGLDDRSASKGRAHLLLGPVGSGKSTRGLELARENAAVRLTLDEWMAVLFRPDRPEEGVVPWYVERAARAVRQIWTVAERITAVGVDVVLELGLLRRSERQRFFVEVRAAAVPMTIHVVDAPREIRRERVEARNLSGGPTFSAVVPPALFELASDFWEPLEADEWPEGDVHRVWTGPDGFDPR